MLDWGGVVNLLIQIPLVGIFVWFVLKRDERMERAQDKRDEAQNRREAAWREFLTEERTQNNEAIARLAEEIERIAERLETNTTLLVAHDTRTRPAVERILQQTERQ